MVVSDFFHLRLGASWGGGGGGGQQAYSLSIANTSSGISTGPASSKIIRGSGSSNVSI